MAATPSYSSGRSANGSSPRAAYDPIQPLLQTWLLVRATALARKRKWKKAEALLSPVVFSARSSVECVDLLAKIYAQQGRLNEAQALWCRAFEMDNRYRGSEQALERCFETRPSDLPRLLAFSFACTVVLFLIFGGCYYSLTPVRQFTAQILAGSASATEPEQNTEIAVALPPSQPAIPPMELAASAPEENVPVQDEPAPPPAEVLPAQPAFLIGEPSPETLAPSPEAVAAVPTENPAAENPTVLPAPTAFAEEPPAPLPETTPVSAGSPPETLQDAARRTLAENEIWSGLSLQVEQQDSCLSVIGEVPSPIVRSEIEQALRTLPGVMDIDGSRLTLTETYVVQPGDKLIDIAVRFYGDKSEFHRIARYNHLYSPNDIKYGQVLRLPRETLP